MSHCSICVSPVISEQPVGLYLSLSKRHMTYAYMYVSYIYIHIYNMAVASLYLTLFFDSQLYILYCSRLRETWQWINSLCLINQLVSDSNNKLHLLMGLFRPLHRYLYQSIPWNLVKKEIVWPSGVLQLSICKNVFSFHEFPLNRGHQPRLIPITTNGKTRRTNVLA